MSASDGTVTAVLRVVRKHVSEEQARAIVTDLLQVQGNQSFRDTIFKLANQLGIKVPGAVQ